MMAARADGRTARRTRAAGGRDQLSRPCRCFGHERDRALQAACPRCRRRPRCAQAIRSAAVSTHPVSSASSCADCCSARCVRSGVGGRSSCTRGPQAQRQGEAPAGARQHHALLLLIFSCMCQGADTMCVCACDLTLQAVAAQRAGVKLEQPAKPAAPSLKLPGAARRRQQEQQAAGGAVPPTPAHPSSAVEVSLLRCVVGSQRGGGTASTARNVLAPMALLQADAEAAPAPPVGQEPAQQPPLARRDSGGPPPPASAPATSAPSYSRPPPAYTRPPPARPPPAAPGYSRPPPPAYSRPPPAKKPKPDA